MSNLLVNPIVLNAIMASGYKASTLSALGSFQYLRIENSLGNSRDSRRPNDYRGFDCGQHSRIVDLRYG